MMGNIPCPQCGGKTELKVWTTGVIVVPGQSAIAVRMLGMKMD